MIQPVSNSSAKTTFGSAKFHGEYSASQVKEIIKPVSEIGDKFFHGHEVHVDVLKIRTSESRNPYSYDELHLNIHPFGKSNILNRKPVWKVEVENFDLSNEDANKLVFEKIKKRFEDWTKLLKKKKEIPNMPSDEAFLKDQILKKREKIKVL